MKWKRHIIHNADSVVIFYHRLTNVKVQAAIGSWVRKNPDRLITMSIVAHINNYFKTPDVAIVEVELYRKINRAIKAMKETKAILGSSGIEARPYELLEKSLDELD